MLLCNGTFVPHVLPSLFFCLTMFSCKSLEVQKNSSVRTMSFGENWLLWNLLKKRGVKCIYPLPVAKTLSSFKGGGTTLQQIVENRVVRTKRVLKGTLFWPILYKSEKKAFFLTKKYTECILFKFFDVKPHSLFLNDQTFSENPSL